MLMVSYPKNTEYTLLTVLKNLKKKTFLRLKT